MLVSRPYLPTDYEPWETLPAPAPPPLYDADLAVFNGTNPNGVWSLYVADDFPLEDGGAIGGGWSLGIAVNQPVSLTLPSRQPGGEFQFTLNGEPGLTYTIQRSSDLVQWFEWMNVTAESTSTIVVDADATNQATLFYRIVSP